MITIKQGQEMKLSVKSSDIGGTKNRTIRYVDPRAINTTDYKVTSLVKELMQNSQDTYNATSASVELGILEEEEV